MARYTKMMPMTDTQENIHNKVSQYLATKKYKYTTRDGEPVFQKGDGVWVAASFIRLSYAGGFVRLEAWIDAMGAEQDLEGVVGSAAKKPLKKVVAEVESILAAPGAGYVPAELPTADAQAVFAQADQEASAAAEPLGEITRREYYKNHASDSFKKNIKIIAIIGYVLCGIVALTVLAYPIAILDLAIWLGLTLGMHLGRSKGCAIAITLYAAFSMIVTLLSTGTLGGWGWLAVGICAWILFHNEDKRFRERVETPKGSALFQG